ncbi:SpoIIE family protein phosphatase [Streptomyces sp. NBC_01439]|uniref:SpoIIE family protein phosphatase n=1 Tax=Streptomyces sp. NBC_01439 TaxID=2903867 RepID=UPI002E2CE094|nr:SpoIIE family protein phosphatase [Streptomyces sp. NBC_01439]
MWAEGAGPRPLFGQDVDEVVAAALAGDPSDVNRLVREYRLLRQVLDGARAGIALLDTDLRYLYVSPHMAVMNGLPAEALLGRTLNEVLPDVERPDEVLHEVLRDGRPRELVLEGRTLADSPYESRVWRGTYHRLEEDGRVLGLAGIGLEVSAPRERQRELSRTNRRLLLLDTAAVRVGTTLDVDTTCRELTEFLVPGLADAASVELIPREGPGGGLPAGGALRLRRVAVASVRELSPRVRVLGAAGEHVDYQPGSAVRQCLESGEPWRGNFSSDEAFSRAAPSADRVSAYREAGIHSGVVVPLIAQDRPIGTLTLVRAGDSPAFGLEDVVVARTLAERAAASLAKAERFAREQGMALELQQALLSEPTFPHDDLEVASRYLPSGTGVLVGGDWFDCLALPGGRTLLVMGDVMGHGVEAAVAMSHYRSLIRALAASGNPPADILREADQVVFAGGLDRVATCLLVLVDRAAGTCVHASAGHLPAMVIGRGQGPFLAPVPVGPPLGTGYGRYEDASFELKPGCVLMLFTDGLVERRGEDIEASLQRLTGIPLPVDGALNEVIDTVLAALRVTDAEDDVTVLAARTAARRGH